MNAAPCPPLDYFLMHTVIMLNCTFFFNAMFMTYSLSQQVVMEWRSFVCVLYCIQAVIVSLYFLIRTRDVLISGIQYIFCDPAEWRVLDGVCLLISFKEILFACLCPWLKIDLFVFLETWCLPPPPHTHTPLHPSTPLSAPDEAFSVFSSQTHWVNPALEMGQLCLLNYHGRL